jgi:large subunit ribosomal protein L30e
VNVNEEIRKAVESGEVALGADRSLKLLRSGRVKMVVLASNCPEEVKKEVEHLSRLSGIPLLRYSGSSWELGEAAGKPFAVNVFSVLDPGSSHLLSAVEG